MNSDILSILEAIERDKGIDREVLIQAVESALASAAKKSLGVEEDAVVTVTIDRKTGKLLVRSDEHEVRSMDFSRIAAQTAKQVIIQKIREAEREVIFEEFQGRVGDIVTGTVHRFERGDIIVELGRAEAILPRAERIPHEEYQQSDRLQGYVVQVQKTAKGPAIVLSRTHEGFIRGLFALEVPEIAEGIVEIKAIAREAGDRTKIAVASTDEKVDCVGACVGMRGTRVKNIVRELHGEKIDIIRWHEHVSEYIGAALSPAKIREIQPRPDAKRALVIVDDDQLSLAIGKKGQNVRLASKLTGWELEIQSQSQLAAAHLALSAVPGVGPTMETRLKDAGITSVEQLAGLTLEQLTAVKGIGEKTAQRVIESAVRALEHRAAAQGASAEVASQETEPVAAESPAGVAPLAEEMADPEPSDAQSAETPEEGVAQVDAPADATDETEPRAESADEVETTAPAIDASEEPEESTEASALTAEEPAEESAEELAEETAEESAEEPTEEPSEESQDEPKEPTA